jgi:hypothetical protein
MNNRNAVLDFFREIDLHELFESRSISWGFDKSNETDPSYIGEINQILEPRIEEILRKFNESHERNYKQPDWIKINNLEDGTSAWYQMNGSYYNIAILDTKKLGFYNFMSMKHSTNDISSLVRSVTRSMVHYKHGSDSLELFPEIGYDTKSSIRKKSSLISLPAGLIASAVLWSGINEMLKPIIDSTPKPFNYFIYLAEAVGFAVTTLMSFGAGYGYSEQKIRRMQARSDQSYESAFPRRLFEQFKHDLQHGIKSGGDALYNFGHSRQKDYSRQKTFDAGNDDFLARLQRDNWQILNYDEQDIIPVSDDKKSFKGFDGTVLHKSSYKETHYFIKTPTDEFYFKAKTQDTLFERLDLVNSVMSDIYGFDTYKKEFRFDVETIEAEKNRVMKAYAKKGLIAGGVLAAFDLVLEAGMLAYTLANPGSARDMLEGMLLFSCFIPLFPLLGYSTGKVKGLRESRSVKPQNAWDGAYAIQGKMIEGSICIDTDARYAAGMV